MASRYSRDLPGQEGMVILEYIGGNAGDETWYGPVTRTTYVLGGSKKRGYVDKRDAHGDKRIAGMLAIRERGRKVFVEIEPEKEQIKTKRIPDPELIEPQAVLLATKSIPFVRKVLPELQLSELEAVLNAEKANKNRSTAIAAIEAQLERVA